MVSLDVADHPEPVAAGARVQVASVRRGLLPAVLAATFGLALLVRLLAHNVVITADEDNWMKRSGGFTYGLLNGQFGRTYQNGHPGVTTMWVAMLTLGPSRMVQFADRVTNQRLVAHVPGFWDALVDARVGFAVVTAALVTLIAGLSWRLFGPLVGALTGVVVGLEPFYLAISQLVHMDAILSGTMVASVLAALIGWERGGGRRWLVLSGVLGGLAFLSKVPAVFLLAFVPMLGVGLLIVRRIPWLRPSPPTPLPEGEGGTGSLSPSGRVGVRARLLDVVVWGLVFVATVVALWPSIWVLGPVEVLGRVAEFTRETGGQPHEQGTFFWGQPTEDPGPFFYPVAMAFRLAPLTVVGLVLLLVFWRRLPREYRWPVLALVGYLGGFLLMMTLGAKKFDRYLLPDFPAFGVLAAIGLGAGLSWLWGRRSVASPRLMGAVAGLVIVGLAAWPAAATYPYYLSYYSPLLGGGRAAQRTVMVGNGEGLDQVAAWLNARPDAENLWVISHSFDVLQALIVGSGESLRDRVPSNADYVVLYRFQMQIEHSPRVLDEYLTRRTPEHVVWINGIEYARIYRGPHQSGGGPAGEGFAPELSSADDHT
jgi:hypothetical protein